MDCLDFLQRKFMCLGVDGTIKELNSSIFSESARLLLSDTGIITEENEPNLPLIHKVADKLGFEWIQAFSFIKFIFLFYLSIIMNIIKYTYISIQFDNYVNI